MGYNNKIFNEGTGASEVMAYLKGCEEVEYSATLNEFHINQLLAMISNMQDTIDKQKEELKNKSRRDDSIDALFFGYNALRKTDTTVNGSRIDTVIDGIKDRIEMVTIKDNEIFISCYGNPNPPTPKS